MIDNWIERTKKLNGTLLLEDPFPWCSEVSKDAIRHFCLGVGDDNPLWLDSEYGKSSIYGCNLAPPFFVQSVAHAAAHGAQPVNAPLANLFGGQDLEWFKVIKEGDHLTATKRQTSVYEKKGKRGNRLLFVDAEAIYKNQNNEIVAKSIAHEIYIPHHAKEGVVAIYAERSKNTPYKYSQEEINKIDEGINRSRRSRTGWKGLRFEDIRVGDELVPKVKGPWRIGDHIAFLGAVGYFSGAMELAHMDSQNPFATRGTRTVPTLNPATNTLMPGRDAHFDQFLLYARGLPAPFDQGPHRIAFAQHLITDWMGDRGFLKTLSVQIRKPVFYGDTTWLEGKVVGKRVVPSEERFEPEFLIDVKITGTNQLGEINMTGSAIVNLPGTWGV